MFRNSTELIGKLILHVAFFLTSLIIEVKGYFQAEQTGSGATTQFFDKLIKHKNLLTICVLQELKNTDWYQLESAHIAALPSNDAIDRLIKLSALDNNKLSWYAAINGLSKHNSFITRAYLCRIVMYSGDENVRLSGYIAARDSRSGILIPLAIIDYFQLRPIPVRTMFPYTRRENIISSYISACWHNYSFEDFILLFLFSF
ncbi:MAG TPA: hypothetical protein VG097_16505 [Gemmata sp.]|jgi:hypothetical protein|nr:hypothetical protein [Gemmata sp.]